MRLFILAAGKGTRLWPLTKHTPKVLIDFGNGFSLLENHINRAVESGFITDVVIISGYLEDQIQEFIDGIESPIPIKNVFNPFYDISNNLMSLWVVHNMFKEKDFIITNGDNLYNKGVLEYMNIEAENSITVAIDYKEDYDEDDMKVSFDEKGEIRRIHKEIDINETKAESVGLCVVKGNGRNEFRSVIEKLSRDKAYRNRYWLEIFNELTDSGYTIDFVEIDQKSWNEMDFHPDVDTIKTMIKKSSFEK